MLNHSHDNCYCPETIDALTTERDHYRELLARIAALDPEDSSMGRNEWGESEMFEKAQEIARESLA